MSRPTEAERFFAKVQKTPICWLWTAGRAQHGHGVFGLSGGGTTTAHRWSYEFHFGSIPVGLHLDHLCRVANCVNPAHLEPVTCRENIRRGRYARNILLGRRVEIDLDWPGFIGEFAGADLERAA